MAEFAIYEPIGLKLRTWEVFKILKNNQNGGPKIDFVDDVN